MTFIIVSHLFMNLEGVAGGMQTDESSSGGGSQINTDLLKNGFADPETFIEEQEISMNNGMSIDN